MNPQIQRALGLWPLLLVGMGGYIALMAWFWFSSYFGAEAVASRLAVGDAARKAITLFQAGIAFAATGSFAWFLLAPKRNWRHGALALSPYVLSWIAVSSLGANTSFTRTIDYKYCSFDRNSLQISGFYDLSPDTLKKPPPYFDPKNGRPLIGCADAERQKEDILTLKASKVTADAEKTRSDLAARESAELERRTRESEATEKERLIRAKLEYPPEIREVRVLATRGRNGGCTTDDLSIVERSAEFYSVCFNFDATVRAYPVILRLTPKNGQSNREIILCNGTIQQGWTNYYCDITRPGESWTAGVYLIEVIIEDRLVRSRLITIS